MKILKQIISTFLLIALLVGMVPTNVLAIDATATSQSGQTTIEGTNSFGDLLSEEINEQQETEEENYSGGYTVTGLTISDSVATVTYSSLEEATLVVALYTEDGLQLLVSGNTTVQPEETEVVVELQGEIPEYFTASAYLLDNYDYSPLCTAYDTPMYTREMQELLVSSIDDYEEDRVLNLDDDKTTNFAVYTDSTVVIKEQEGVNTVVSANDETATYVFENADQNIADLQAGQVFAYSYGENEILIVKVASININGTTVTILGDDLEIEEAFSHIKIESTGATKDFKVDDSTIDEGVNYNGIVKEDGVQPYSLRLDGEIETEHNFFEFSLDKKLGDNVKVKGTLGLNIQSSLSYYVSATRQFIEFKTDGGIKADISVSGKATVAVPLGKFYVMPVFGVAIGFEPEWQATFSGNVTFSIRYGTEIGFSYESGKGSNSWCTTKEPETDLSIKGTVFVGIDLKPTVAIIDGKMLNTELSCPIGLELSFVPTGKNVTGEDTVSDVIHTCYDCLDITFKFKAKLSVEVEFFKFFKYESDPLKLEFTICEMYRSFDYDEWLLGECPHKEYRVTFKVLDNKGVGIPDVLIDSDDSNIGGITNSHGVVIDYMPAGSYSVTTTVNGKELKRSFDVSEARFVSITENNAASDFVESGFRDGIIWGTSIEHGDIVQSGSCSDSINWYLYSDGLLYISGTGEMELHPFRANRQVKSVVISSGITSISDNAFEFCSNLTSITIPDSVTYIGQYAFWECRNLKSITIPDSVTSIGDYTFSSCIRLTSVTIPNGVTHIGQNAFSGTSITSITLPTSLTSIGDYAFVVCEELTEINIPSNVEAIGKTVFDGCNNLTGIWVDDANPHYSSDTFGVLYNKDKTELIEAPETLEGAYTVSSGTLTIRDEAFSGCRYLTSISIPYSVEYIGEKAFYGCDRLFEISIDEQSMHYCLDEHGVLYNRDKTKLIDAPDSLYGTYTIPNGVTSIGNYAFSGCAGLTNVEIPDSVTSIGIESFYCGITSIVIPASVISIDEFAFMGCDGLTITFKGAAPEIAVAAFNMAYNVIAYYPVGSASWNSDVLRDYGGYNVTWIPYAPGEEPQMVSGTSDTVCSGESEEKSISSFALSNDETDTVIADPITLKTAFFSGLTPSVEHVVMVMESIETTTPLESDNLLFIKQVVSDLDGKIMLQYIPRVEAEFFYVVARGASKDNLIDATISFPVMIADNEPQAIGPTVDYNGKQLIEGKDYIVVGDVDFTFAGEYTCYIRGINNYTGLVQCKYKVWETPETLAEGETKNGYAALECVPSIFGFTPPEDGTYRITLDAPNDICLNLRDSNGYVILAERDSEIAVEYEMIAECSYLIEILFANPAQSGNYTIKVEKLIPAISLEIIGKEAISGYEGFSKQLNAKLNPDTALKESISWSSSNPSVATITNEGLVNYLLAGTTIITAYSQSGLTDSITLTVISPPTLTENSPCTATIVDNEPAYARFTPERNGYYRFYYSNLSNNNIPYFMLIQDGTSIGQDDTYLSHYLYAGTEYLIGARFTSYSESENGSFTIHVAEEIVAESIQIDQGDRAVGYIGEIIYLTSSFTPEICQEEYVYWASSNTEIATVSHWGAVELLAAGTVVITATSENGLTDSITITVDNYPVIQENVQTEAVISQTGGRSCYFSFTPEESGYYAFYSISDTDTYGYILDANLNALVSDDDSGSGGNFMAKYYLNAGQTYVLQARYFSSSKTGSFSVCIERTRSIIGLEIVSMPVKTSYIQGFVINSLNYNGLGLKATWSDGSTTNWKYDGSWYIENEKISRDTSGVEESGLVVLNCGDASVTLTLTVTENPVDHLEVVTASSYKYIENYNGYVRSNGIYYYYTTYPSDAVIKVVYKNGTSVTANVGDTLDSYRIDWTHDQYDEPWVVGTDNPSTVTYLGHAVNLPITVETNNVSSIEVVSGKVTCIENVNGHEMSDGFYYYYEVPEDITVRINYNDSTSKIVNIHDLINGYGFSWTADQYDKPWTLGDENYLTLSYLGITTPLLVSVVPSPVDHIDIITVPAREYIYGDTEWGWMYSDGSYVFSPRDLSGLKFTVYYTDGTNKTFSEEDIDDNYLIDGYEYSISFDGEDPEIGDFPVTFTYIGKSVDYTVKLKESPVTAVEVTKLPITTQYNSNYVPDFVGMEFTIVFTNGASKTVTITEENLVYEYDWNLGLIQQIDVDGYVLSIEPSYSEEGECYVAYYLGQCVEINGFTFTEDQEITAISLGNVRPTGDKMNVTITYQDGSSDNLLLNAVAYGDYYGVIEGYAKTNKGLLYYSIELKEDAQGDITGYEVYILGRTIEVEATQITSGDVNDDGVVDTLDRMVLSRYLANWDEYDVDSINMAAADVNGDGVVDTLDRMVLNRYLANWDGYEDLPYVG